MENKPKDNHIDFKRETPACDQISAIDHEKQSEYHQLRTYADMEITEISSELLRLLSNKRILARHIVENDLTDDETAMTAYRIINNDIKKFLNL